jgi:sterol desaturase/sphingolipid hydroxylase (fatty acid hydroxylase superfamily)
MVHEAVPMIEVFTPHFQTFLMDILRLTVWLAILCAIFIPMERLLPLHRRPFVRKHIGADFGYYYIAGIVPTLLMSVPLSIAAWAAHQVIPRDILVAISEAPFWARALGALLATEIGYYWGHRWTHTIPILWRFHAVHHSAREIDFMVSTHAHPVDTAFSHMCSMLPLYVFGLAAPAADSGSILVMLVNVVGQCWGYFLHANVRARLGPLEKLITTPAFHHWHHTLGAPTDRNYSAILPWLDRIFGTYHLPKGEWPAAYGINEDMPLGMGRQLAQPLLPLRSSVAA